MKKILFFFYVISLNVSASPKLLNTNFAVENDIQTYKELKRLYESSTRPADFTGKENIYQTQPDYVGCVYASEDGKVIKGDWDRYIVKSQITIEEGNGPLFPAKIITYYAILSREWIDYFTSKGASFSHGVLNYDGLRVVEKEAIVCNDDTMILDTYKNVDYRISDDKTEMVTIHSCNDSTKIQILYARLTVENLLVGKSLEVETDGSTNTSYLYCWP